MARFRHRTLAVWLSVCTLAAGCSSPSTSDARSDAPLLVTEVIDGDTIIVSDGRSIERVRLIGIDTPETAGGFRAAECFGSDASARLNELLPVGTRVALSTDVESRDRYGRLLAYVTRHADGLFVNEQLVRDGAAAAFAFEPNLAFVDRFADAEAAARLQGVGLWRDCGGIDTLID